MAWFNKNESTEKIGLVLTGGGAKAAYQVGVIKGILEIIPNDGKNPFQVIAGASAGAINSTFMAAHANRPRIGIRRLEQAWSTLHVSRIYRVGWPGLIKNTFRWIGQFLRSSGAKRKPLSLFMNEPLREFLNGVIPFEKIDKNIVDGHLHAVSVTAFGYLSGDSVTFYQSVAEVSNWKRYHRVGIRHHINVKHLMASSAIPIVFPAVKINREYFGDGSVGFLSPISPSLHMGADKIVVISIDKPDDFQETRPLQVNYPSIADISGRLMDSVFTDSLEGDLERLQRINATLKLIPEKTLKKKGTQLKHIDFLRFSPTIDVDELATLHINSLPKLLRFFLNRVGITNGDSSNILSYLLFEKSYTRELIQHGYEDAIKRRAEILEFFTNNKELPEKTVPPSTVDPSDNI